MPRLLIDGRALTNKPKGVGRYAYHLCCQLNDRLSKAWQVDVLVSDIQNIPTFSKDFRARFVPIPMVSELRTGFDILPKQIKKLGSDILLRPGEAIGSRYGIPIVTVCHDINEWIAEIQASLGQARSFPRLCLDKVKSFFIGRALRHSDYILCNSEFIRISACHYYGVQYQKTMLAYCGVDHRFYDYARQIGVAQVLEKYRLKNYVLTFATGDHRENFIRLPQVIKKLADENIETTFVIAGIHFEENYYAHLKCEFDRLGLIEEKHYLTLGFFGEDQFFDLVELYTAADFCLELSLHEGFGMQVAEAMACGTTCISSMKGALKEVADGYAIVIDDPRHDDAIAEVIKTAYQNNEHHRDNTAQIAYTKKFAWDHAGSVVTHCLLKTAEKYKIN